MSRAYRIAVRESLQRLLRAGDQIRTDLEILEILPREQMGELLKQELQGRGFQEQGQELVRTQNGVTVTVDPSNGQVAVTADIEEQVRLEGERVGRAWDDVGPSAKEAKQQLRQQLCDELEKEAEQRAKQLQSQATERLEAQAGSLRQELDQAVNRVTAAALKQKAAQLGAIKEMTEDPESGALTIVLEV